VPEEPVAREPAADEPAAEEPAADEPSARCQSTPSPEAHDTPYREDGHDGGTAEHYPRRSSAMNIPSVP
jgi:hypothetical protein